MTICAKKNTRVAQGKAQPDYSFLEIFSDKAFRIVRRNYAAPGFDGISIKDIKRNYRDFKERLIVHKITPPQKVTIIDYTGETREINKYNILDVWLQTSMRLYVESKTGYKPRASVFSYRQRDGENKIKSYIESWSSNRVLCVDIADFYGNVSTSKLIELLKNYLSEYEMMHLAKIAWDGAEVGLPVGNSMSILLSNYYLDSIDKEFKAGYARYGDDFFFDLNIYDEKELVKKMKEMLKELNLEINESKIKIIDPTKAA